MNISTEIFANGKRYSVIDTKGETIPGNTRGKDIEYCVILASEPTITWYEFKKQPLDERFDLPYLYEKLKMDKKTARDFIPQFNALLD
jgi:hypothetical protein